MKSELRITLLPEALFAFDPSLVALVVAPLMLLDELHP
jgi:hypothetical protein